MRRVLDGQLVRRWFVASLAALGTAREEIDALNVYPVPDGDTGTNLFLTVEAAVQAIGPVTDDDVPGLVRAAARGALLGARGNSGVILSQLLRGISESIARTALAGRRTLTPADFANALTEAAELGYDAVAHPVEGTMLSVARAAATSADDTATAGGSLVDVVSAAAHAARVALDRTPDQLEILRRAGVVDAGGRGVCVILDALESVLTGRRALRVPRPLASQAIQVAQHFEEATDDGPAYEVMYLLHADDDAVPALRAALEPLGDSLVVVGGDGLWNIHVHVDDAGAAVEAGLAAGRPHRIRITGFPERLGGRADLLQRGGLRRVVAVAAGDGLAKLFKEARAEVVRTAPTHRPSTGEILAAVEAAGAAEVVVLPNDPHVVAAAEAAAREAATLGIRVAVLPTRAQVQGIAALAVHDPGRSFDADVVAMTTAAGLARHGGVTIATKQAVTSAGVCQPGDSLGAVGGDFVVIAETPLDAAAEVLERLLAGGGELVTVVWGEGADDELVRAVETHVRTRHPEVDVDVHEGGQPRYLLLLGVE